MESSVDQVRVCARPPSQLQKPGPMRARFGPGAEANGLKIFTLNRKDKLSVAD